MSATPAGSMRRRCGRCSPSSRPKAAGASPQPGSRARCGCSARPTCAMASRSSRSPSTSTGSTGTRRTCCAQLAAAFHRRHEELYTYALPDQEAVLVNARVAVIGELPAPPREPGLAARPPAAPRGRRRIWLGAWQEVPVLRLRSARARPGDRRPGDRRGGDHHGPACARAIAPGPTRSAGSTSACRRGAEGPDAARVHRPGQSRATIWPRACCARASRSPLHDLERGRAAGLLAAGAAWAGSPEEVARRADSVITCLPSPAAVSAVVAGPGGVLAGLRPGGCWIDMSTNDPAEVQRLGALAAERGIGCLEAPVTGGVHKAATRRDHGPGGRRRGAVRGPPAGVRGDGRPGAPHRPARQRLGDQGHHQHAGLRPSGRASAKR